MKQMVGTLLDAFPLPLKVSGSTSQSVNPLISISKSINDPWVPSELITEIFLRLPVKSLLKFKCISKWWLSHISSPEFIKSHFAISCKVGKEGEYLKHQLLFTDVNPESCIKQCSVHSALHDAEPPTLVCDFQQLYEDSKINIVGIVNGLVCVAMKRKRKRSPTKLCLWNPALRKFKQLPSPILNLEPPITGVAYNHGFWYDELTDDYKVFCVLALCVSEGVFKEEIKVYSLRADSWRVNDNLKDIFPMVDAVTYADGKMYWCADVEGDSTLGTKIVTLDMASEKCGELQPPAYEISYVDWKLGVVCGRLFAFCDDNNGTKLDIYVMDKYGGEECWRKVDSIPLNDVNRRTQCPRGRVICFVGDDEIVIRNGHGFLVYHRKHKTTRNIEVNVGESFFRVVPYVESLVSPLLDGSNV